MNTPILKTEKFVIRAFEVKDLEAFAQYRSQPEVAKYQSWTAYAFGKLKMHRVVATTDAKNVASYRLLEKLGFRREAHFLQNIFFKGAWGDEYQYALLHSEQKFTY